MSYCIWRFFPIYNAISYDYIDFACRKKIESICSFARFFIQMENAMTKNETHFPSFVGFEYFAAQMC